MSVLAVAGAALFAGGTALEITQGLSEGKDAARTGKRNQRVLEAEAKVTEDVGLFESGEKRLEGKRLLASQIAQAGAQGGSLSGTNLTILADTAIEVEKDARIITRNARLRATGLRQQGALARFQGRQARRASRIRAFGTGLKAGGQLLAFAGLGKGSSTSQINSPGIIEARDTGVSTASRIAALAPVVKKITPASVRKLPPGSNPKPSLSVFRNVSGLPDSIRKRKVKRRR